MYIYFRRLRSLSRVKCLHLNQKFRLNTFWLFWNISNLYICVSSQAVESIGFLSLFVRQPIFVINSRMTLKNPCIRYQMLQKHTRYLLCKSLTKWRSVRHVLDDLIFIGKKGKLKCSGHSTKANNICTAILQATRQQNRRVHWKHHISTVKKRKIEKAPTFLPSASYKIPR